MSDLLSCATADLMMGSIRSKLIASRDGFRIALRSFDGCIQIIDGPKGSVIGEVLPASPSNAASVYHRLL